MSSNIDRLNRNPHTRFGLDQNLWENHSLAALSPSSVLDSDMITFVFFAIADMPGIFRGVPSNPISVVYVCLSP